MWSQIIKLNNGQYAGCKIAEITSIPFFELLDKDARKANAINQVYFAQLLNGFHRKCSPGMASLEILWTSTEIRNQTYKAQVRIFFILRQMGDGAEALRVQMDNIMQSLKNDFEEKNYVFDVIDSEDDYSKFLNHLESIDTSKVVYIAKNECVVPSLATANGLFYYTDVIQPSDDMNISYISNALAQNPGCAVSLQIIPTVYTQIEILAIEQSRTFLTNYSSNLMYRQGIKPDASVQALTEAYNYYAAAEKELLYYYNILIYSKAEYSHDLTNKLIDTVESAAQTSGNSLIVTDISSQGLHPAADFTLSPWINSDKLVYKTREKAFWDTKNAPVHLKRLKFLMTPKELRSVFKLPIDDGKTTGFNSRKTIANREKLQANVISEDNFKIGVIQNASRGHGQDTHTGLALNDFTKHGLIVGMPGSGKTNFSLGLLLQFWRDFKIPFLAIEPTKTEYRSLIDEIKELQIFTPGKNQVSPYIINPFIPPRGVTIESYIPSLTTAFKAAFSMPNPLPDIFLGAVNDCYNEYGWKSTSTAGDDDVEHFGLYEFIKVFKKRIQNIDYKGEVKANIESAGVVRLISLIEQNSNIYDTIHTIPIEDILAKPTVIELNAINNKEQKSLIMALLLILICVYTKNNIAGDGRLKNVMLIDEAHVLLSASKAKEADSADSQGSTIESLEDLIAEIRSYGTSIIIADQSPTKVGRNIIANTNVKIIFKLVEKENKDAISTATNMTDAEYEILGRLGVGEALLHHGRLYHPLHIRTYNVFESAKIRAVIPDGEIVKLMNYWDTHQGLLIPHRECKYNDSCRDGCEASTRASADFIALKLVNEHLYAIKEKSDFLRMLVSLNGKIEKILQENPSIVFSTRLSNCAKIKFLRKAMLIRNFAITKNEYGLILEHKNFLKAAGI